MKIKIISLIAGATLAANIGFVQAADLNVQTAEMPDIVANKIEQG